MYRSFIHTKNKGEARYIAVGRGECRFLDMGGELQSTGKGVGFERGDC
jgi:hypothetical protein